MKSCHRILAATGLTVTVLILAMSSALIGGQAEAIDELDSVRGRASQDGVPMLDGTWKVTVTETDTNSSYVYGWEVSRGRDTSTLSWRIKQTLLETNNPAKKGLKGQSWDDSYFEFKDGLIEYTRARGVYSFSQWATCNFKENSFECTNGKQSEFGRIRPIKIEGSKSRAEDYDRVRVEVLEITGEVEIIREGQSRQLKSGDRWSLFKGDRIITGMDTKVRLRFPNGIVVVRELTDMTIEELLPGEDWLRTECWLTFGEIQTELRGNRETAPDFSVKAPVDSGTKGHHASNIVYKRLVATTKGDARFSVRKDQQTGSATVSVTEGVVSITIENGSSQSLALRANQRVEVTYNSVGPITGINTVAEGGSGISSGESASGGFARRDNTTIGRPVKILRYFGYLSEDSCKSACATEQGCVAYTFVRPGGYQAGDPPMCLLMSSLGPEVTHSCCVSGFKAADDTATSAGVTSAAGANKNPTKMDNEAARSGFARRDGTTIAPPAKILRSFGSPSEDACWSSCASEQGCVAYTFVRPGGYQPGDPPMCYLMSSLGPEVAHSCCVSGFKDSAGKAEATASTTTSPPPRTKNGERPRTATDTAKTTSPQVKNGSSVTPTKNGSGATRAAEEYVRQGDQFFENNQDDNALDAYNKAVQLKPSTHAYSRIGAIYIERDDWKNAVSALQEALRLDPNHVESLDQLALSYQGLGRHNEALEVARRSLSLDRNNGEAYFRMGWVYNELKRHSEALTNLREATRLLPEFAPGHFQLGVAYHDLNQLSEALRAYRAVIALDPDHALTRHNLVILFAAQGDRANALQQYRILQRLDNEKAERVYPAIENMSTRREAEQEQNRPSLKTEERDAVTDLPPALQGKTILRTEKVEYVECWSPPNVPCSQPNLETFITIYHLEGGGAYWDRREYDRRRKAMTDAGNGFKWSCDKPLWRNGRCG